MPRSGGRDGKSPVLIRKGWGITYRSMLDAQKYRTIWRRCQHFQATEVGRRQAQEYWLRALVSYRRFR